MDQFTIKAKHVNGLEFVHTVDSVVRKDKIVEYYKDYQFVTEVKVYAANVSHSFDVT